MRGTLVLLAVLVAVVTAATATVDPDGGSPPAKHESGKDAGDAVPVAQESMTIAATGPAAAPTAAELDDLRFIAKDEGISVDEAVRRFGWQGAFGAAVDAVQKRYPARYSGSSMQTDGDLGATIELTGSIPTGIADLITAVPVPVTVTGDARHSEQQVREAVETAHYAARAEPSTGQVSTEYAEDSGTIIVTTYGGPTPSAGRSAERASIEQSVEQAVEAEVGQFAVDLQYAPARGAGPEAIRGGAILNSPRRSQLACTSGWSVRSTDSRLQGLITARHCDNDLE